MKKILTNILLCTFVLLCTSCFEEADFGFPKTIKFSKEGGEKVVAGDVTYTHATIQDYKGNQSHLEQGEDDLTYAVYKWLKVEYKDLSNEELKIYAEPNTSGKSRKLYIELYSGPEYQVIKVKQD